MKLFDAHCHLDDPRILDHAEDILERAQQVGVQGFLLAGYSPQRWPQQRKLVELYPTCKATYGLHPWFVAEVEQGELVQGLDALDQFVRDSNGTAVGIGEFGLDRSSRVSSCSWERQVEAFRSQLALARSLNLPVVLHAVKAHQDVLQWVKRDGLPSAGGMVHGFSGSFELGQQYLREGLFLSLGGALTYPKRRKLREAAARWDGSRLLCESDAPDQPPVHWDATWNEPSALRPIVMELAALRCKEPSELAAQLTQNTRTLFALGD
ncbi:MAG: TatD family deoxyribonuclease [Deltaproteobacteria bacterium]|nr:MAG: TatD family deoxyribonuclease [Deltaproteobacteria bacterium]